MIARIPLLVVVPLTLSCGLGVHAEAQQTAFAVHVRLSTPVASYMPRGTPFVAKVVGTFDLASESEAVASLPPGSTIEGIVAQSRSIGLGVKSERASLELSFTTCTRPNGESSSCRLTLTGIDNARESVSKEGRIQGILAAAHPHSWLGGIWSRPGTALSGRSAGGLTGAGGKLQSVLAPSPLGVSLAIASRLVLFRLPDGEIELPAGTDLILHSDALAGTAQPITEAPPPTFDISPEWKRELAAIPTLVTFPDGRPAADIINVAFVGSREQLDRAFAAAGWKTADPLNAKTFARGYAAVAAMRTDPTAPVSPLHYQGELPEAVFQKSFNSISKRHHIRLWQVETSRGKIWVGAATHDIAVAFEWSKMTLTHKIDPSIDLERHKLLYDLAETGCIDASGRVERADQVRDTVAGDPITTDGVLVLSTLRDCAVTVPPNSLTRPRKRFTTVVARRFVLEGRHYFTRGNAYYWMYRGVRWTFSPRRAELAGAPRQPRPASTAPSPAPEVVKIVLKPDRAGTDVATKTRPLS